ncbi:GNAT family N-acetyltransferase [Gluconobacter sp. AC10]|uniref:GNAT family N-acetyltransferase n=1 Tax=Gluconobacter aidae TaxID=2662454 RepID=A0A7X1SQI3_9PROT|nr:GNAT family N-acetyltransferase [Gluconobacter aidae]MQR99331.1 GNAT family N-acetyltransferase [Gluconobacter aidae]
MGLPGLLPLIREAGPDDLPAILRITNDAIENTDALWITTPFTLEQRRQWFEDRLAQGYPVLVVVDPDGVIAGYGSYGAFRAYEGYARTVEHSVYVAQNYQRRGIGRLLLRVLVEHAKAADFHVMVAGITADNAASVAMHHELGFRNCGTLPQVGRKRGRWLDLLFMTLRLDDIHTVEKDFS